MKFRYTTTILFMNPFFLGAALVASVAALESKDFQEFLPQKSSQAELLCRGTKNLDRRVILIQKDGQVWGRVFDKHEMISSGFVSKKTKISGSGKTLQTRSAYRSGSPGKGGFHLRIVDEYKTFRSEKGPVT